MSVSTGEWVGIGIGLTVLLIVIGYLIYKHNKNRKERLKAYKLTSRAFMPMGPYLPSYDAYTYGSQPVRNLQTSHEE